MAKQPKLEIWHGNFNKFIVLCNSEENSRLSRAFIKKTTKKYQTDGLIQISPSNPIEMRFFDTQGILDNCGNAMRVTAIYCKNKGLCNTKGIIKSLDMLFPFQIKNNIAKIEFKDVKKINNIWIVGKVKHLVVKVNSFEKTKTMALRILKKEKCNVTLVKKQAKCIFAKTFETGLERFTDACGTGAVAASMETGINKILMPGGLLTVNKNNRSVSLSGEVEKLQDIR